MNTASDATKEEWILLKDSKQWSRLLYTNPVCFLCCSSWPTTAATTTGGDMPTTTTTTHHERRVLGVDTLRPQTNVTVVSWLTATNNSGGLVLSLNRRRHSVAMLLASLAQSQDSSATTTDAKAADPSSSMSHTATSTGVSSSNKPVLFTLSVPIRGMEELIRQVGSVSGRDVNKFPAEPSPSMKQPPPPPHCDVVNPLNSSHTGEPSIVASIGAMSSCVTDLNPPLTASFSNEIASSAPSKRQMKKRLRTMGAIPGLKAVPVALYDKSSLYEHLACIDGTVAHLVCRITTVIPNSGHSNDNDAHVLLMAQVEHAAVQSRYWDGTKNLFRPCAPNVPPYLSFFGSQTFGYVVTQDCLENGMGPLA